MDSPWVSIYLCRLTVLKRPSLHMDGWLIDGLHIVRQVLSSLFTTPGDWRDTGVRSVRPGCQGVVIL